MNNETSRPGSPRTSARKTILFLFVVAAMALGAFGTGVASAHGVSAHAASKAKTYKAKTTLKGTKSGKPTLTVTVSSAVKGGEPISKVGITLPKGFSWSKKKDVTAKGKSITSTVKGRTLTVTPKFAVDTITIKAKKGAIKETKKARSAKAGKVKLKVTEISSSAAGVITVTNGLAALLLQTNEHLTTIENTTLNGELTDVETDLLGGGSVTSLNGIPVFGSLIDSLTGSSSTSGIASEIESAISGLSGSGVGQLEGLASVDNALTSGAKSLTGQFTSLEKQLEKAGVPAEVLSPVGTLVTELGNGVPEAVNQIAASIITANPKDPASALAALQAALEANVSKIQGDLLKAVAALVEGVGDLSYSIPSTGSGGSSSPSLGQLQSLITELTSTLGGSGSSPLSGLSAITSLLGGSSSTNPLSEITELLSSSGSNPLSGLEALTSLLGASGVSGL